MGYGKRSFDIFFFSSKLSESSRDSSNNPDKNLLAFPSVRWRRNLQRFHSRNIPVNRLVGWAQSLQHSRGISSSDVGVCCPSPPPHPSHPPSPGVSSVPVLQAPPRLRLFYSTLYRIVASLSSGFSVVCVFQDLEFATVTPPRGRGGGRKGAGPRLANMAL